MQDDQPCAEFSHQANVVIDDANPHAKLMSAPKQMNELNTFAFVDFRSRLVKQELRRASAESDRNAKAAQISERHHARHFVGEPLQVHERQKLFR